MAPKVAYSAHHTMSRRCSTFQLFACHQKHVSIFYATTKQGGGCFARVLKLRLEPETSEWNATSFQMSASLVSLCSFSISILPTVGHFYLCVCVLCVPVPEKVHVHVHVHVLCICVWSASHTNTNTNTNKTHTLHSNTNTTTPTHQHPKRKRKRKRKRKERKREEKERKERREGEKIMKGKRKDKEKEKREGERRKRKTDCSYSRGPSGELFPITVTGVPTPEN